MFCGNCGSEMQEGLEKCPKCSRVPNIAETKIGDYPLINLSAKLYAVFTEIGLWLILISGPIFGGIIGNTLSRSGEGILPGIILGFIIGFILMVEVGGLISIFLKIKNNTDKL